jgi:diguanylate cyclase (GGDEF)-like protein
MGSTAPRALTAGELAHPVEIADRIWWVGQHLEGDHFQCHTYLIEHDDQSVLVDPGSRAGIEATLRKVEEVTPLENVRWFLCQHPDPDITSALPMLDERVTRPDAAVATHWRAWALMKHYGIELAYWLVDEHDWTLDLGGRVLRFVFTPYLHFPGAFVTFDEATGTLFSSDLFGGFTEDWHLWAEDMSYFESIRPFHEHYMPSRDILLHGLEAIEGLPVRLIAPQHGELVPEPLVQPVIARLKDLECGIYLLGKNDTDIRRLSEMTRLLRIALDRIALSRDFAEVADALLEIARPVFSVTSLEFYAHDTEGQPLRFEPGTRYRGIEAETPEEWVPLLGQQRPIDVHQLPVLTVVEPAPAIAIPLFSPSTGRSEAVAVLRLREPVEVVEVTRTALAALSTPLEVALERELLLRSVEVRRQELYDVAMRDALTGLYNRLYLRDSVHRLLAIHDRGEVPGIVVSMFDIDHFKDVNDTFGHAVGDVVLRAVGSVLQDETREGDIAARLGGEEFAIFHVSLVRENAEALAERVRVAVAALLFDEVPELRITISAGIAVREVGETRDAALARADASLYDAKRSGRDRVVLAEVAER